MSWFWLPWQCVSFSGSQTFSSSSGWGGVLPPRWPVGQCKIVLPLKWNIASLWHISTYRNWCQMSVLRHSVWKSYYSSHHKQDHYSRQFDGQGLRFVLNQKCLMVQRSETGIASLSNRHKYVTQYGYQLTMIIWQPHISLTYSYNAW